MDTACACWGLSAGAEVEVTDVGSGAHLSGELGHPRLCCYRAVVLLLKAELKHELLVVVRGSDTTKGRTFKCTNGIQNLSKSQI